MKGQVWNLKLVMSSSLKIGGKKIKIKMKIKNLRGVLNDFNYNLLGGSLIKIVEQRVLKNRFNIFIVDKFYKNLHII